MRSRPHRTATCLGLAAAVALTAGCQRIEDDEADPLPTSSASPEVLLSDDARAVLTQHLDEQWLLVGGTSGAADLDPGDEVVTFSAFEVDGVLHLGGNACNGFGMPTSGEFAGQVTSTAMACEGGTLMEREFTIMDSLPRITDATVDGDTLTLTGKQLELIWTATTD